MPPITELRAGDPSGLGGYEIRGRLGEGVQGVVYLGVDEQGRQAAVKWLRPELAGDGAAAERFAREVAAAQRVAPFCTAKVLDSGVHEGRPYIVSEYVDGLALERAVREEGPRTGPALHRLAIGTATALAAIHQAGIVHRDFSPGNVLLGSEGPRVIGFGIARALDVTSGDTTVPVGDSAFLAPEQLLGDPTGPAADMFAWACTIVFAASGAGPFAAGNMPATVQRVLNAEPDLGRLTGTLRELVAACLSKDPGRRPTAEQVIHRLLEHPTSNPDALHHAAAAFGATPPTGGPSVGGPPSVGGGSPVGGAAPPGGAAPVGGASSPGGATPVGSASSAGGGSSAGGWPPPAGGAYSPGAGPSAGSGPSAGGVPSAGGGASPGDSPAGGWSPAGGAPSPGGVGSPGGGVGSPGGGVPSRGVGSPSGGVPVGGGGSVWQVPGGERAGGSGPQGWAGQPPYPQSPYPPPTPPPPGQYRPLRGDQPPGGRPGFEPPAPFQRPGTPPRGIPYGGPPPSPSGNRRNWVIGGAIAGVALVAAIAIVVVTVVNLPPKPKALPTPVPATTTTASPSPTVSPVPTANLTPVRLPDTDATVYESPDDPIRLTTYMVMDPKSKDWVYYARDSLTGGFTKYRGQWESMLSPDGRYLAQRGKNFIDNYDSVEITDKTTGERFSIKTSRQPLSAYIQAWSRDSTRVLVNVGNPVKDTWQSTGFAIVDVTTRKATVASLREGSLKNIRYGFDDTDTGVVAMSINAEQQALRFFDAGGLRVRRIPNVGAGIADELFSPSGRLFVTDCPGLESGNNCVYDSRTGAEVKRIESACGGLAAWFDDDHLLCWVRPDSTSDKQQVQVIDFTGKMVRLLAEVPTRGDELEVVYTFRKD
ncbi:protein kinase [Nonomuraea sp. NPDC050451]|uniref:protein kinase domain-containing protein n=1 Tax=Nonomuraea sp. NPDC050451 TaxID=3364364 RepID=UPI003796E937